MSDLIRIIAALLFVAAVLAVTLALYVLAVGVGL